MTLYVIPDGVVDMTVVIGFYLFLHVGSFGCRRKYSNVAGLLVMWFSSCVDVNIVTCAYSSSTVDFADIFAIL